MLHVGWRKQNRRELVAIAAEKYGSLVMSVATSRLRGLDRAQDVFQEVFVSLYTSRTIFADEDHLRRWLVRATENHCKNVYRSLSRRPESVADPSDVEKMGPQAMLDGEGEGKRDYCVDHPLWEAVERLPECQKKIVRLFYIEGYSTDEIAQMVGVSPVTVRTRLNRARTALRMDLEKGGSENG